MIELIGIVLRWKLPIAIVCLIAGLLSVGLSLTKPNFFKSTVVFLAANPYMIDRSNIFSKTPGENPVFMFGSSRDIDRLLSIGKSQPLIDYIIYKYQLLKHYDIDESDPLASFKVNEKLWGNYKILKNSLDAIEVHVEDTEPQKAADMANDIVRKMDSIHLSIMSKSKADMAGMLDYNINDIQKKLAVLKDSITSIRAAGNLKALATLETLRDSAIEDLSEAEVVKDQYKTLASNEVSSVYILQQAVPSVKKSKPKRSIIVLSTLLAALFCSAAFAIIFEQLKAAGYFDKRST